MESLNRRHKGEAGNAQLSCQSQMKALLGCTWVPLSARIVSLMSRGLFMHLGCISFFKHSAVRFVIELYVWNLDVPLCPFCRVVLLCQLPPQCGLRGCPWDNQTIDCVCKLNSIPESQICLILVLSSSSSHYLYCEFLLIERKFVLPFFVFFFFPFIILKITESRSRQNMEIPPFLGLKYLYYSLGLLTLSASMNFAQFLTQH